MKRILGLAASFLLVATAIAGCTPNTSDSEEYDEENVASVDEAMMKADTLICCTNIGGWGSVVYYQEDAGLPGGPPAYVTTDTFYKQGVSCPYEDNTCVPVGPAK